MLLLALEFVSGFLFGSGLVVAGMVNPAKVEWMLVLASVAHAFLRSLHSCLLSPECALLSSPFIQLH